MWLENPNRVWYDDDATVARFLMGGIGTGNFSIGSRGQLCDWELFNKPEKGARLSYSFFSIRTQDETGAPQVRLLESRLKPPYERANGYESPLSAGIPCFQKGRIAGEVSCAMVELRDDSMPVEVDLYAFSPFIPLNPDDSAIPGAVLRYKVKNTGDKGLDVSVAGCLGNAVGYVDNGQFGAMTVDGQPENEYREQDGLKGVFMTNPALAPNSLATGSMALMTATGEAVTAKPCWMKSSFWDGAHEFWNDFTEDGGLTPTRPEDDHIVHPGYAASKLSIGALCGRFHLLPGEEREIEFILAWHFPNRPHRWPGGIFADPDDGRTVRNHYATIFGNAWDAGRYLHENMQRLERDTDAFRSALYATTLPAVMLDAMAANITVLRSSTCFRIEDGTFLGWEGSFDDRGSCEGNCSHVWCYQQTLAFLYPMLERDMRRVNFEMETLEDGEMCYRANTVFGYPHFTAIPPAADGQMAAVVQLYRDWKLYGDDNFLKRMWPGAVRALEYAFTKWDEDGDYVFEAEQHNTFDIEFYGPCAYTSTLFYAALKAAEELAAHLGEQERAARYRAARQAGANNMDAMLFNGEYYVQKPMNGEKHHYQYYDGCLANQLFGQQLAQVAGLGYLLPKEHVKSAVYAIYKHNFLPEMSQHLNVQRVYAQGGDAGLICCSWPNGGKPAIPFIYSDEVWSGLEYVVASQLIQEGFFEEALTVVRAVRNRHDGIRRNPWNEEECGNHYVRSMASWSLLLSASGFGYDMAKGEISFAPKVPQGDFTCFFSTGKCWGVYRQREGKDGRDAERGFEVLYGDGAGIRLK